MTINYHTPQYPLRKFVKSIFCYENYSGASEYELILPDTCPLMVITLDENSRFFTKNIINKPRFVSTENSWIQGIQTNPILFKSEQKASSICIQLELSGLASLLKVPANELADKITLAEDFFGREISELREFIFEKQDFHDRMRIVEKYLIQKMGFHLNDHSYLDRVVSLENFSLLSLDEISSMLNFSKKHTIALFRKRFGLTPRKLQILQNVNKSLEILNNPRELSMVQTALECNHFDQSHFIKNFKLVTSLTPSQYLSEKRVFPHVIATN